MTEEPDMKLLLAFDTSPAAAASLHDLVAASLPSDTNATVLAISGTTSDDALELGAYGSHSSIAFMPAEAATLAELEKTLATAQDAERELRILFPTWEIRGEARAAERPEIGILDELEQNHYDLLAIGADDRSLVSRAMHRSTVRHVITQCPCSIRIGRLGAVVGADLPHRIVVGVDGSAQSKAAVEAIAGREWPAGSVIRVVGASSFFTSSMVAIPGAAIPPAAYTLASDDARVMHDAVAEARQVLEASGLTTIGDHPHGTPAKAILQVADRWGADTIFLGAQGERLSDRTSLGSVAYSVAMHARCSVEIVRS